MPRYTVESENNFEIEAKNAQEARKQAADTLGREYQYDYGSIYDAKGKLLCELQHDGSDGRAGWVYTDASGEERKVFPAQRPKPGTLWTEEYEGAYETDDGLIVIAFKSDQYEMEDFALVGAVYYAIYGECGEEDGGWMGYYEEDVPEDWMRFVREANHVTIKRKLTADYDAILDELEEGVPASEIIARFPKRSASKSSGAKKAPAKKKATTKKKPASKGRR